MTPIPKSTFWVSPTLIAIEMRVGYEVVHLMRVTVVPREVLQKNLDLGYMYVYIYIPGTPRPTIYKWLAINWMAVGNGWKSPNNYFKLVVWGSRYRYIPYWWGRFVSIFIRFACHSWNSSKKSSGSPELLRSKL